MQIMGILNLSPDSFSGEGQSAFSSSVGQIVRGMIADGANIIDVGAESSRPGAEPICAELECRRVVAGISAIRKISATLPISVDTRKPEVAETALECGATIVNDILGLSDPDMIKLVARSGTKVVIMHSGGSDWTTRHSLQPEDGMCETITKFFRQRIAEAEALGITRDKIILDVIIAVKRAVLVTQMMMIAKRKERF